jgi:hypothetical protein
MIDQLQDALSLAGPRTGLAVLLVAFAAGCGGDSGGPERVPVSGTVTLGGQPLPSGLIRFIPDGATTGPASAAVIEQGRYELSDDDGPVPGHHRVEIEATNYLEFAIDDEQAYAAAVTAGQTPLASNPVPMIYNRQSTLTAEVSPEVERTYDYNLQLAGTQ